MKYVDILEKPKSVIALFGIVSKMLSNFCTALLL